MLCGQLCTGARGGIFDGMFGESLAVPTGRDDIDINLVGKEGMAPLGLAVFGETRQ